jgi:hypothetical protein
VNLDDLEENEKFRGICDRAVFAKHNAAYKWYLQAVSVKDEDAEATILVAVPASVRKEYSVPGDARAHIPNGYQAVTYSSKLWTYFLPVPTQESLTVSFRLPFAE